MRSSAPDAAVLLRQIARNATDDFVSVKEAITLVTVPCRNAFPA